MPKNTFNDIVPPERRSIRNIQRSRPPRQSIPEVVDEEMYTEEVEQQPPQQPPRNRNRFARRGDFLFSSYALWGIAAIVVLLVALGLSLLFSGSKVVVTPKQKEVRVEGVLTAYREPVGDQLPYELMEFEETATLEAESTGTENVEERASGRIIVYNDFSESEQRLITNTRFETPDGLIYRIQEPVVVPGQRADSNGELVPGSIEVAVYADEPGSNYNIGLVDFTIPGFKGAPQFEGFYARSKTPMTGGFVGERVAVDEATREQAERTLREEIRESLIEAAQRNKPEEFYFFDELVSFNFSELAIEEKGNGTANISVTGKISALIFSENDLAERVVRETVAGYNGEPVRLDTVENLEVTPTEEPLNLADADELSFTLSGTTKAIWLFDEHQLQRDLSGRQKEALTTVLSGYPGILRAEVILRPFWKQAFPENPGKINIEVVLEEKQ